jgi:L-asparaginase/Glu-tRNA(Gln) amidotransferase subunit D
VSDPDPTFLYIYIYIPFGTPDWIRVATEIELNYSLFDAFVILHGTDTMAYTSSALSFLLEDLGKTVVRVLQLALSPEPSETSV